MTSGRLTTRTESDEEMTIVDLRSLDPVPLRSTRSEARFARPPPLRGKRWFLSAGWTAFGFASLGVALLSIALFAVREHRTVIALQEALQVAEARRVQSHDEGRDLDPFNAPEERVADPARATQLTIDDRLRAERQAVDLLVANNDGAALERFEALRNAFPQEDVYRDFAVVLQWRTRCGPGDSTEPERCE